MARDGMGWHETAQFGTKSTHHHSEAIACKIGKMSEKEERTAALEVRIVAEGFGKLCPKPVYPVLMKVQLISSATAPRDVRPKSPGVRRNRKAFLSRHRLVPREVPKNAIGGTLPHLHSKCVVIRHHLRQFHIVFPANGEVPEIVGERPDGVNLQGVQSKMRRVRHGKVDKSQGHSSFYVHAQECLFFTRSRLGEGQVALHGGYLEQHNKMKLTPQAQLYKDSGYAPDTVAVGTVAAQPGLQWSDTEPDSDGGLDSCEEIREHVETPTKDQFLTTAFYGVIPHSRAKKTRTLPPRKAKANRRMGV
ncbi:hypothetical protein LTR56_025971 [Elasticomyces elasticus]|nr:hypothetical protein LTR56_025971 [Elasticomyces elasticus]